jgi:hypothetical protein
MNLIVMSVVDVCSSCECETEPKNFGLGDRV